MTQAGLSRLFHDDVLPGRPGSEARKDNQLSADISVSTARITSFQAASTFS